LGQKDRGKEMLRQALKDAQSQDLPQRDVLHLKAIHRQFVDGDLEAALAEYRTIMELFPDLMPPANNAGRIIQALGRFDEAAAMYEEASRRAPRSAIPLQNLWFLQINFRKDTQAAEKAGRRFADLAPAVGNSHSMLGYSLAVQEKFDEAEIELRKTLEFEPDHPYALPNLGHVLFAAGKASEAVPYYRRTLELVTQGKLSGTPEWDSIALALALWESGQGQEASAVLVAGRTTLEKKIVSTPASAGDWITLGAFEAAAGDFGRAGAHLNKAKAEDLKDANMLMDLAEVCALMGRPVQALEYIRKSLDSGFSDPFFPVLLPAFQSIRKNPEFRAIFKLRA
jgi:Flp pilus assembly protein TadD